MYIFTFINIQNDFMTFSAAQPDLPFAEGRVKREGGARNKLFAFDLKAFSLCTPYRDFFLTLTTKLKFYWRVLSELFTYAFSRFKTDFVIFTNDYKTFVLHFFLI